MATSLSLVLKHLEPSQQTAIVDNIVSQLKNNSENEDQAAYVDTFCEILNINTSLKSSLGGFAYEYITDILRFENPEGHFDNILKLTLNIDTLATEIISFVVHNLKVFLATNPRHFNEKITSQVDFDLKAVEKNYDLQQTFIQNLLVFTEWYFIHNEEFAYKLDSSELDNLCYFYITNEILDISKYSSKVLKWRMPSICQSSKSVDFLWKMIFLLQQSGDKTEISYGYVLWLRFFNQFGPEVLKSNERFQLILSNEDYWYFLRDGLTSTTHEHKKFSLTLIQMSVQALSTNLSLPVISWDVTKEDQFIESWKRFCTLYEILGIDSAMNQAQAAANDLLKIFSPASDIPVPFALTILSVGFRASQDRIKKFALNLAFTLPKQSLSLFKYDFKFISHVFLPFTMKSNHFSVVKSNDSYSCEFGDKIDNFICNCVDSLDDPEEITNLVKLIFDVIGENRLTFGIARIYIVWGVLKGLEKKPFKPLNQSVLPSLCSLFETVAEGDIARTTLQTVHLRILLQVDASSVTLKAYVQSIVHFVQMNGYDIYRDNEEFFLDYFTSNFTKDDFLALLADENIPVGVEEFIVITSHLLSSGIPPSKITPYLLSHLKCCEIIVQMAASRLNFKQIWSENLIVSRIERLINDMVVGSEELDISVYSDCDQLLKNVVLFSNEFWMSMRLGPLFAKLSKSLMEVDNIEEANYCIAQYKFFSLCFPQCVYNEDFDFSFTTITPLLHQNLKNIPKGSDPTFYKSKDGLTSYIVDNITALFKITTFDSQTKNLLLNLANDVVSMSAYNSHLSNVRLLASLLDSLDEKNKITSDEAKSIVGTLELLWGDIIADRLVLNQRNLHQSFIKLVLHPKLLICSIDDEELGDSLFKMLDDIVTNSSGRKGLLPCLFKHVSMYQVYYNESFERTLWLAKLLVKGTFLFQSELNIFQLDCIISENFDKHLNISGESVYTQSYGEPEVSYHVSIFAVAGSVKTEKFATEIWNYILENESIFRLRKPKKRTDREEQWKRIQLLSLMVSVVELVEESRLLAYMKDMLLPRLFNEASPLCRTYIEWLLCLTIQRIPHFKDDVFEALKEGIEAQQPLVMCVFERISMLISMQLDKEAETEFLTKFVVDVVLPTSSSNRALNRHFSSSMACVIYHEIIKKDLPFPPLLKETLSKINDMSVKSEGHGNYKTGDALLWDINKDCNLVSITGGLLLKVTDREIDAVYEKSYNSFLDDKQKSILRLPIGRDESSLWVTKERSSDIRSEDYYAPKSVQEEESSLLQTKSGVWSTVMELDENVRAAAQVRRSPLIVVSSLVDKPPNLGGICRLCDCLGAGWMTVDDISVKEDPEFKTVAVTADRWMPLIEVKIHEIIEFMRLKKKEGYTLIGLEQTDKSVELNSDLKFPEKSLILIGKEREGIPGDLLAELDMCVIIKQVGIVRSMNIQTATAVIVHAYSSQHC